MSEQWHDDHKKAIAEKWTQCPPVTTKVKELIGDEVCMGTYRLVELEVMQLETELAEARAEIERLKQLWSSNLDIINRELNKQLAEARARLAVLERGHDSLIEEQASLCTEGQGITELVAAKGKLIEQMREALKTVVSSAPPGGPLWYGSAEIEKAVAAIKAAERGE